MHSPCPNVPCNIGMVFPVGQESRRVVTTRQQVADYSERNGDEAGASNRAGGTGPVTMFRARL